MGDRGGLGRVTAAFKWMVWSGLTDKVILDDFGER